MKNLLLIGSTLLLGAAAGSSVLQEGPAAVVVKVEGDVRLHRGEAEPAPATVGSRLNVGDRVHPAEGGRAFLVRQSGQTQVVTEPVTIEAAQGTEQGDMFSRTVRVLAQAANSDARVQANRQGMIRPIPGEPTQVAPRNGITVRSTRPTFTWHSVDGADSYTVQIRRPGEPPRRFEAADTVWSYPEDEPPLERGATYMWTVAPDEGRPARERSFTVLSEEGGLQLKGALAAIEQMGLDPRDDGRLLSAVVYTDLGLLYEAADVIGAMESSGEPLGSDLYLLKGEVMDAMGRLEEARMDFDRADAIRR